MIIDFEGIDGTGKRTQSNLLKSYFQEHGRKVILYSYPDYESKYGKIIKSFLDSQINLNIDEQFLLYLVDMVKDKENIQKLLQKDYILIMDRYFLSSIAYQCANGFDYQKAKKIIELLCLPIPSIIFYLETSIEVAQRRKSNQKGVVDRFESDIEFFQIVIKIYENLIKERYPSPNWIKLDGGLDSSSIHQKVITSLSVKNTFPFSDPDPSRERM